MSANILVVEDEPDIAALVAYHLAKQSYRVQTASTGREALESLGRHPPELVVLDWMLPGLSGLEVLREMRNRPELAQIPVVLLTARREEADLIEGLSAGADDYLAKPFSPQELVLRVGAVLRRVAQAPPSSGAGRVLRVGPFTLDVDGATAEADGKRLDLTPTEFRLLQALMEHRGRVQSRQQLLASVWEISARLTTRTVDMHVQRLRSKLGDAAEWLETVRGFGYRLRAG